MTPNVSKEWSFYGSILLLKALEPAGEDEAMTSRLLTPKSKVDLADKKLLLMSFLNKLSFICDCDFRGKTVTSFILLQSQEAGEKVHYKFASNERATSELKATTVYVKDVLDLVDTLASEQAEEDSVQRKLLTHIIRFNRSKISFIIKKLEVPLEKCLVLCDETPTAYDPCCAQDFRSLSTLIHKERPRDDSCSKKTVKFCFKLLSLLQQIQRSRTMTIVSDKAHAVRMPGVPSQECWYDLLRRIERLLAYPRAVDCIMLAGQGWPANFGDVEVSYLEKPRSLGQVRFPKENLAAVKIIDEIFGASPGTLLSEILQPRMQALSIDDKIHQQERKTGTVIHAEMQLYEWIIQESRSGRPARFFGDWQYIGGSKPVCRLCEIYFQARNFPIERRASHGNLYTAWRFPEKFGDECPRAVYAECFNKLAQQLSNAIVRGVFPPYKRWDTNTYTIEVRSDLQRSVDSLWTVSSFNK